MKVDSLKYKNSNIPIYSLFDMVVISKSDFNNLSDLEKVIEIKSQGYDVKILVFTNAALEKYMKLL